jgi:hypothetical protein
VRRLRRHWSHAQTPWLQCGRAASCVPIHRVGARHMRSARPAERHGLTSWYGHGNGGSKRASWGHIPGQSAADGSSLQRGKARAQTKTSKVGDRRSAWARGRGRRVLAVYLANLGLRSHGHQRGDSGIPRHAPRWYARGRSFETISQPSHRGRYEEGGG